MEYFKFIEDNLRIHYSLDPIIKRADVVRVEPDGDLSFCIQCIGDYTHSFNYETKAERDEDYNRIHQWIYGEPPKNNKEIDWEQRRYEIAKSAMQGIVSHTPNSIPHDISQWAVEYADALIRELKKEQE